MLRRAALLLLGVVLAAPRASAQVPAGESWSTVESAHFRVSFTAGLEPLARHTAAAAERARTALVGYVSDAPAGTIEIILSDNLDLTNGSAWPFPRNRIHIYARPPFDVPELNYMEDWVELVVTHELAHVFHIDVTSKFGGALRSVFGRVPFDWPFFPSLATPRWSVEGLAVAAESQLTPMGRLHGTHFDMVARTAALEDTIDDIDRLSSESALWPGGQRVYVYGSLFLHHVAERFGQDAIARIVQGTATAVIPPSLWFDRVAQRTLGISFRQAYDEWRATATVQYRALADSVRAQGVTETRVLAHLGGLAAHPRYSPDGKRILYAASDRRSTPRLRVLDAASGQELWEARLNGAAGATWAGDAVVAPQLEFRDPEHVFYDLYHVRNGDAERLTEGERLQDPDVASGSGRVVAVQNGGGTNRLVLLDADGGGVRPLGAFDPAVHWNSPRWSPNGDRIAVSRWTQGGRFDVVVLDSTGAILQVVTDGRGVNTDPAWTPDARMLVFSSDRSGISNLYAHELATGTLRQVTNVLTGAFAPDISPDGRSIVFSAYHHDGYAIEVLPFDAAALRQPLVALLPERPAAPSPRSSTADTTTGPVAPYGAWRSALPTYWAPILESDQTGDYFGALTGGSDLVERHAWFVAYAHNFGNGRNTGSASYTYLGLPTFASLKPALSLSAQRTWDRILDADSAHHPFVDEREDVASLQLSLLRARWRWNSRLTLAGELVRRRRVLGNAPDARLIDPEDRLYGARITGAFANARTYPFSISAEDGVTLQLSGRKRHDPNPTTGQGPGDEPVLLDGSYREATAWAAAYRSLGRVGFANAVFATRASALLRDGPGASRHGVGGSSGSGIGIDLLDTGSEFLPVRGFPEDTRVGLRAWSATAELRLPLAQLERKPRPLPLFLHTLAFSAFADAGDADCPSSRNCGPRALGDMLLAAGGEAVLDASLLGFRTRLRFGLAAPLAGEQDRAPRAYFQLGSAF